MTAPAARRYTPEEYLAFEREAEYKNEYIDGRIVPAMRVSMTHMEIVGAVFVALRARCRGGQHRVYASRVRVQTMNGRGFVYPDVVAVRGEHQLLDESMDTLLNPALIVEVLSNDTEAYDRGEKFQHYRTIESLQDYVLVAQDRVSVEHFVRQGRLWRLATFSDLGEEIELTSVGCAIPLREIYENVEFPAPAAADAQTVEQARG
jgi:Uma2 family endonuclease